MSNFIALPDKKDTQRFLINPFRNPKKQTSFVFHNTVWILRLYFVPVKPKVQGDSPMI